MQKFEQQAAKKRLSGAIFGTLLVALCCFTPVLIILLAAVGLSVFTPYLDYILFPALAVMVVITILTYGKYRKTCISCEIKNVKLYEDI